MVIYKTHSSQFQSTKKVNYNYFSLTSYMKKMFIQYYIHHCWKIATSTVNGGNVYTGNNYSSHCFLFLQSQHLVTLCGRLCIEQYQVKIFNRSAALENFDDNVDLSEAKKDIRQTITMSARVYGITSESSINP
jgi:hypothetical protein